MAIQWLKGYELSQLSDLLMRLWNRKVIQFGVLYLGAAWLLLQAAATLEQTLELPTWTDQLVFLLLAIGFPLALILAWAQESRSAEPGGRAHTSDHAPALDAPSLKRATQNSIAVLPFVNMSSDPEQEYFSDGISEELLNLLAKIKEMRVAARTSSFGLKGTDKQVEDVGKLLGVAHVLEGSVRKSGNRIRITAQLIETAKGFHLWSETYDRTLDDIFAVQDEIAASIVDSLKGHILGGEDLVAPQSDHGTNVEAYDHYLRGHFLVQETAQDSIEQGLDELRTAIKLDPTFALPYADISDAISQMISYGMSGDKALLDEARNAAFSAVALAPDLAQAHSALASVHQYITMDWQAADAAFETAIGLAPQSPIPFHRYADFLVLTLRLEKAREMSRRAIEVDPRDRNSMHAEGLTALFAGDFPAAVTAFGKWNQAYPKSRWSYVKHAVALALDGQCDAAFQQARIAETLSEVPPDLPMASWLGWSHQVCGRQSIYENARERILAADAAPGIDLDGALFYVHCIDGNSDALVKLVRRLIESKSPFTELVQIPLLDHLGWAITAKIKDNREYRLLLDGLNFPKTNWTRPID